MTGWLHRNAAPVEAIGSAVTALVAVVALAGVWIQISAADHLAREQSARDTYRAHLALAVANPDLAEGDLCRLHGEGRDAAYTAFVEHLIFSTEQIIMLEPDMQPSMAQLLEPHSDYLCLMTNFSAYEPQTETLIRGIRARACGAMTATCAQ